MSSELTIVSEVAERYAAALFDLAKDASALDAVKADLDSLADSIQQSEDLARLVRSPLISDREQAAAIVALADKAGMQALTRNFLGTLAQNGRLFSLEGVAKGFAKLLSDHRGEVVVEVSSAQALTDAQQKQLKSELSKLLGKDVEIDEKVDAELLGGLVVRVGSRMVDGSLKTKLQKIELAMKGVG